MKRALEQLAVDRFDFDRRKFCTEWIENYKTIINGDEKVKVISAASIIAKVYEII